MLKKVLCIFMLIAIALTCIFSLPAYAGNANFSTSGFEEASGSTFGKSVGDVMKPFVSITRIVVIGLATVMLLAVAMKYMMSAPGERAEIKGSAIRYIIGASILYGTGAILTILDGVSNNISN